MWSIVRWTSSSLQNGHVSGQRWVIRWVWVRRVWPILRRVRTISSFLEGWLDEPQGTGISLSRANLFPTRNKSFHSKNHWFWMNLLMWVKRSELEGSSDLEIDGDWVACFAASSTTSLSGTPAWPGTQSKVTIIDAAAQASRRRWIIITSINRKKRLL